MAALYCSFPRELTAHECESGGRDRWDNGVGEALALLLALMRSSSTSPSSLLWTKCSLFGLEKSRLVKLGHKERTYHAFYQLLAGDTRSERDPLQLEDHFTGISRTYRLPSGLFSDDTTGMPDRRAALRALFEDTLPPSSPRSISPSSSPKISAPRLLGISAEDVETVLANRTT
ncbi:hypothetical protein B0H13DRAFT_410563 [Mycena leptocephala]|nr:hypothetical protein B0H13DRAFT_410563 [Mycena leptocephala]